MALALARQGLLRDARDMLDRGESLLVATADRLSHALILCDRAEIEFLASRDNEAERAIKSAREIATQLDCRPDSELRRRLAAIEMAWLGA